MSVKIRMKRGGTTNRPFYRVVVIDSRMQRDGRFIEELGYYDPIEKPQVFNVDRDRVAHWITLGAQPSDTVRTLLKNPNNNFAVREQNREFTAGPTRPKPVRSESDSQPSADRGRGGRDGGRGGRGGPGGGRFGGGGGRGNLGGR
ncbi:MAG: small subunit ribosomal protein S16, partial [bacterium]